VSPVLDVLKLIPGAAARADRIELLRHGRQLRLRGAATIDVSMQMAEASLLPAVRKRPGRHRGGRRHQLPPPDRDGAQREAVHVAVLLERHLPYGEIAAELGDKGLSRAVGQAMGHNPFAPVVPCHRVLAAGNKPGGFSAGGGALTKLRMLGIEGARPNGMASLF
jgi:O-6-methylguanine DNA methyltransferase